MKKYLLGVVLALSVIGVNAQTLDVLVLYPDHVTSRYSASNLQTRIETRENYTNNAFRNSESSLRINVIHHQEINLSNDQDVNSSLLSSLVTNKEVMDLRDTHRPDLTVYLTMARPLNDGSGLVTAGLAYFPKPGRDRFGRFIKEREMAFRGVSVVAINSGADTFAHEIGHNLGAGHGRLQNAPGFPISTNRGWGVHDSFTTIMPYDHLYGDAEVLQYFSNPSVSECLGANCGTSIDNAVAGMGSIVDDYVETYSSCYPTVDVKDRFGRFLRHECGENVCLRYRWARWRKVCTEWE